MLQLKRAHSADPDSLATPELSQTPTAASESMSQVPTTGGSPANNLLPNAVGLDTPSKSIFQSPLKKYRPSVDYGPGGLNLSTGSGLKSEVDSAVSGGSGSGSGTPSNIETQKPKVEDEEEL